MPSVFQVPGPFLPSCVVVEMDLPWDSTQVETYGASFKSWEEKEFARAWTAVRKALPHNQLTCVVRFMSIFCVQKYSEAFLSTSGCLEKASCSFLLHAEMPQNTFAHAKVF